MGDFKIQIRRLKALASSEWFWVAFAFALRAAFALKLGGRLYQADEMGFDQQAAFWARNFSFGANDAVGVVAPVPTFLLGAVYLVSGESRFAARLAQAAVGAAAVWALGRATETAAESKRAGLFAAVLASFYPFFAYYSGMLMSETLYVFTTVAALGLSIQALREQGERAGVAVSAAVMWALAGLTRIEAVPIALALGVSGLGLAAAGRFSVKAAALAAVCWALPLFGWAARNRAIVGAYTLDTHGGITLLDGTVNFDLNEQDTLIARRAFERTDLYRRARILGEVERDALYRREALAYMRANPLTTLRQWARKAVNFWRLYPRQDKQYRDNDVNSPGVGVNRRLLAAVSLAFEPALIVLGFCGAWSLRGRISVLFPLYWMVLATFGVHTIVVSQMRYRLPVMSVLILFSAAFVSARIPLGEIA